MTQELGRPVLLALHYQNEVLHADGRFRFGAAHEHGRRERVVRNAAALLSLARSSGWSVVHVRIAYRADWSDVIQNCAIFRTVVAQRVMADGSWGARFVDELRPVAGGVETVVTHNRVNPFYGTDLGTIVQALRPSKLLVAGVATNSVVEHTVRHAADIGYECVVVEDACAAASDELHEAALVNLRLLGEVVELSELAELLNSEAVAGARDVRL